MKYSWYIPEKLRTEVSEYANYSCEVCDKSQAEELMFTRRRLAIHHLDENDQNNSIHNLVLVCASCHNSHFHRNKWKHKEVNEQIRSSRI